MILWQLNILCLTFTSQSSIILFITYYLYDIHLTFTILLGFKEQIYDVYRHLAPGTQILLLSATLPHEILEMTSKFMTDPIRIIVKR